MINVLDVSQRFQNQWVVLDRTQNVVDSGPDLSELSSKHQGARRTFYFAAAQL